MKVLTLIGLSSVFQFAGACTQLEHGFSVLPNVPNLFEGLLGGL
jgi:hypothetical protein